MEMPRPISWEAEIQQWQLQTATVSSGAVTGFSFTGTGKHKRCWVPICSSSYNLGRRVEKSGCS